MHLLHERCAGLDVHTQAVVAGRMATTPNGHATHATRTFGTTTTAVVLLLSWLRTWGWSHVARERTGA